MPAEDSYSMWLLMASHQNWLVEAGLSAALPGPAESEGGESQAVGHRARGDTACRGGMFPLGSASVNTR